MANAARHMLAFFAACLAAGVTQVLFIVTPADLVALSGEELSRRLGAVAMLTGLATVQAAVFAAPIVLLAAALARPLRPQGWPKAMLAGAILGLAGFFVRHAAPPDVVLALHGYALLACLTAGLTGGLAYWLVASRAR
jgi:hypothetical protein